MIAANLVVRLLLEVVAIASLGYWGWRLPTITSAKVALAVAAPLLLIVVWAFVVAPGAENPLPQTVRMLIGSGLLLLAVAALAAAGQVRAAVVVAAVIVLNTVTMLLFPDDLVR